MPISRQFAEYASDMVKMSGRVPAVVWVIRVVYRSFMEHSTGFKVTFGYISIYLSMTPLKNGPPSESPRDVIITSSFTSPAEETS